MKVGVTPGSHATYLWRGADERLFVVGEGRDVLILPALFAEANRTRAFTVALARKLAVEGMRCTLPDLPGTLESTRTIEKVSWSDWCGAVEQVTGSLDQPVVVAIRGGALLPARDAPRLHFASTSGDRLLRDLLRSRLASDKEAGLPTTMAALSGTVASGPQQLAGFDLTPTLTRPLSEAQIVPDAVEVRMTTDAAPADRQIEGTYLWRRAEPGRDDTMAAALAQVVIEWSAQCAAG